MYSHITTLIERLEANAPEKFNAMLNVFSKEALLGLFENKLKVVGSFSPVWSGFASVITNIAVTYAIEKRQFQPVTNDDFFRVKDFGFFTELAGEDVNKELKALAKDYVKSLPSSGKKAKETSHAYVYELFTKVVKGIIEDIHDTIIDASIHSHTKGDVVAEGPGFEVIVGENYLNNIRYADGNSAILVIADPREGHFLMVERLNPLTGAYVLEFPKVKPTPSAQMQTALNMELRDQTGLSYRDLEMIGTLSPDSKILDGCCEVYYGNFDLEENHAPYSKQIRSLKRITEDGIYQAAFDGRVLCAQTLGAMAIWHAFESVRKKRIANSKRVRIKAEDEEDDD